MANWEKRQKNLRILCAAKGVSATEVARAIDLSPNTLTKFLNSKEARTLSATTLARVVDYFGLTDETDLDSDNPLNDPKIELRRIIENLSPEDAIRLNRELSARYSHQTSQPG